MKKSKNELYNDPWEQDCYETGSTRPPKDRGGAVAVLLVALILLGSLCSALGILNARLLQMIRLQTESAETVSVFENDTTEPTAGSQNDTSADEVTLPLQEPPQDTGKLPADTSFAWLVRITCGQQVGAGLVMTEDGYIITNAHLLGTNAVTVTFDNGMQLSATLIGTDEALDVAVLYVQATGLIPAPFGDSAYLQEGDELLLVGEELLTGTVNTDGLPADWTNTTVVMNRYGQVVGMPTVPRDGSGCLMTETMKPAVDQILAESLSRDADLDITGQTVSHFDHRFYELPYGVLVTHVENAGCADIAGVRTGDVITGMDGAAINTVKQLQTFLDRYSAGDCVTLELYRQREGKTLTLTIILSEAEE